jgi:hypothetical protein
LVRKRFWAGKAAAFGKQNILFPGDLFALSIAVG